MHPPNYHQSLLYQAKILPFLLFSQILVWHTKTLQPEKALTTKWKQYMKRYTKSNLDVLFDLVHFE